MKTLTYIVLGIFVLLIPLRNAGAGTVTVEGDKVTVDQGQSKPTVVVQ